MLNFQFFLLPILEHIRSTTRKSIPVLAWSAPYVFFILRFLGPEKFGGCGDLSSKARALAEKTGRNSDEILDEVGPAFHFCSYDATRLFSNGWRDSSFSCIARKMEPRSVCLGCRHFMTTNGLLKRHALSTHRSHGLLVLIQLLSHQTTPDVPHNRLLAAAYMWVHSYCLWAL